MSVFDYWPRNDGKLSKAMQKLKVLIVQGSTLWLESRDLPSSASQITNSLQVMHYQCHVLANKVIDRYSTSAMHIHVGCFESLNIDQGSMVDNVVFKGCSLHQHVNKVQCL